MTPKKFIEKVLEGRVYNYYEDRKFYTTEATDFGIVVKFDDRERNSENKIPIHEILLNPKAWQAVGKVEGWEEKTYIVGVANDTVEYAKMNSHWAWNMHRMIDALCEGKSIESFLETL